jgi:hypothetical protein
MAARRRQVILAALGPRYRASEPGGVLLGSKIAWLIKALGGNSE